MPVIHSKTNQSIDKMPVVIYGVVLSEMYEIWRSWVWIQT